MEVEGPVAGVVEDEHGVDFEVGGEGGGVDGGLVVEGFGEGLGGGGEGGGGLEGEDGWVGGVDVCWGDDVFEAVSEVGMLIRYPEHTHPSCSPKKRTL